jgi:hypothetical protein
VPSSYQLSYSTAKSRFSILSDDVLDPFLAAVQQIPKLPAVPLEGHRAGRAILEEREHPGRSDPCRNSKDVVKDMD